MVSHRCKLVVIAELRKLGIRTGHVDLGEAEIAGTITLKQREKLKIALYRSGLEIMDSKKSILIEKIKSLIVDMIHFKTELPRINYSDYLANRLKYDYTYLANLFSETEGITIEQFIIRHKIERVKELIIYNELNLTEIAWKMHYSSVAHLSNQFKKVTGLTPSFFKSLRHKRRVNLESVGLEKNNV